MSEELDKIEKRLQDIEEYVRDFCSPMPMGDEEHHEIACKCDVAIKSIRRSLKKLRKEAE